VSKWLIVVIVKTTLVFAFCHNKTHIARGKGTR